jgi:hypothetical protein
VRGGLLLLCAVSPAAWEATTPSAPQPNEHWRSTTLTQTCVPTVCAAAAAAAVVPDDRLLFAVGISRIGGLHRCRCCP